MNKQIFLIAGLTLLGCNLGFASEERSKHFNGKAVVESAGLPEVEVLRLSQRVSAAATQSRGAVPQQFGTISSQLAALQGKLQNLFKTQKLVFHNVDLGTKEVYYLENQEMKVATVSELQERFPVPQDKRNLKKYVDTWINFNKRLQQGNQ